MSRTTLTRLLFATLAIAFFATPVALRAVGVTADAFENRKLADPPKLSQGWSAFQQTTQYLIDRMPLRAQAVRANTRIWQDVFGTDPRYTGDSALASDEALPFAGAIEHAGRGQLAKEARGNPLGSVSASTGRKGWLYLEQEFSSACDDTLSNESVLRRWARLVQQVRAGGREAIMFVAPQKASVYPEHLPEEYPFDHCALEEKERLWDLLSEEGPKRGILELRSELLRLKKQAGDELFELKDLHWTTLGALGLVGAALDEVGGGVRLEPSEIVYRGMVPYVGDLTVISGRQETAKHAEYDIRRPPDAPRIPGRTLLVCDSFAYKWMRLFKPYFENLRYISYDFSPDSIVEEIQRSDRVIVEANEVLLKAQAVDGEKTVAIAQGLQAAGR